MDIFTQEFIDKLEQKIRFHIVDLVDDSIYRSPMIEKRVLAFCEARKFIIDKMKEIKNEG